MGNSGAQQRLIQEGYDSIGGKDNLNKFLDYVAKKIDRLILIDSGLIKGTKAERKQLARVKDNPKEKYNLLGYSYVPTLKDKVADIEK